ncbi:MULTISPECIES: siderophore-interacting protein [unclassified Microbacterium]|uniref:siderophore-interacting protein n=1 Tax=unclassified Microbacterium TaxID=2609290 RepID=UPI000CFCECE5|nr:MULTISPECIES: siderophore-interacting protein [unclassified Microbacterium]PQZ54553.1 NADPH-dependent ferric siderophore reductase [Microbacterium sp. MYb43]PQZ74284.1 NADPH-dependent ferric siderophore reductase [Microbacterium sp. MYb40]PRB17117.1 NADPH-dependent ferric siderophore reductase [Microbacterium sp. MYb54]PRB25267.1 NADPH-dependent ferric siderophore reductase [Microbacterium sp. MYb50]PRB63772.1 NADPH-dependent ferric siderophore reductase [Microbacterium sp. MYb24]
MAFSKMVKPETTELIHLVVLRTERLSAHWIRVTLGGGEIEKFHPMGFDQWFRLFLPIGGDAGLDRVPAKANKMFGYLKFLRIPDGERPVMRNYSVRAYRAATADAGAEIDVDFVLHGSAADGTAGPASRWAETCQPGEHVLIIDEGLTFNPQRGTDRVLLVGDETALPAIASICASLPTDAVGSVIIEVPSEEDALEFSHPSGPEVAWIVRPHDVAPGIFALEVLGGTELPDAPFHAYAAGEQALASGVRKHLVGERGVDKNAVSFCGYWKIGAASPASKAARESAAEPLA